MLKDLCDAEIFCLKPLLKNFHSKLSAATEEHPDRQVFCLVDETNEILLRCVTSNGSSSMKILSWFRSTGKIIEDVCFDPTASWLLVLCYDNTIHVVPVMWVLEHQQIIQFPFNPKTITSFIVPFAGPHECPNAQTCPNNFEIIDSERTMEEKYSTNAVNNMMSANNIYSAFYCDTRRLSGEVYPVEGGVYDTNYRNTALTLEAARKLETNENTPCPYPTTIVWWQTLAGEDRAIIGYSDGTICVVVLTMNCPFIAYSNIDTGYPLKLIICRDTVMNSVTLMINSSTQEQWKLLLEQKSIGYTFPADCTTPQRSHSTPSTRSVSEEPMDRRNSASKSQSSSKEEDDWQLVFPLKQESFVQEKWESSPERDMSNDNEADGIGKPLIRSKGMISLHENLDSMERRGQDGAPIVGLFPAAKARLASLRDLGARKIGALKLKLTESRLRANEREKYKDQSVPLAYMDAPRTVPEVLTTPAGPFFIVQYLRNMYFLSALHAYSDTVSVHNMDISLIPICLYKIPKNCKDILLTKTLIYTLQATSDAIKYTEQQENEENDPLAETPENNELIGCEEDDEKTNAAQSKEEVSLYDAVGIVSGNLTAIRIGEDSEFDDKTLLGLFKFRDEKIINIHRMASFDSKHNKAAGSGHEQNNEATTDVNIKSTKTYVKYQKYLRNTESVDPLDADELQTVFPEAVFEQCVVVTDKNFYVIDLKDSPENLFFEFASDSQWNMCEELCKTMNLPFAICIEYIGDMFLKKKKPTQALLTYNITRIPPVKTALKLAMYGENNALMHLCAMALKNTHLLKSLHPVNQHIKQLLREIECRSIKEVAVQKGFKKKTEVINSGESCSDYVYNNEEPVTEVQLSGSAQFHLSNLLLLTLTDKTILEKHCMPLWNFLVTNRRYHTNMTCIVLCQSGLYESAVLVAMTRGALIDAFCGLVESLHQDLNKYADLNAALYNLSEPIFMECIVLLQPVALDYFDAIQNRIDKISVPVLERLKTQLCPFSAIFRPILSQVSSQTRDKHTQDGDRESLDFCKYFIETYITVAIRLHNLNNTTNDTINALSSIYMCHEDRQFAIQVSNHSPISAGFSHCASIVNGMCYMWGSNGFSCVLSNRMPAESAETVGTPKCVEYISNMGLEVHAVKCGRTHTLILTNNGLFALGSNNCGQLGIGNFLSAALLPMLVKELDGKEITHISAGQYHNAVVADNELYTWGWGVYGQLGNGRIEDVHVPKNVKFFNKKKILEIALGHAHTVVLCRDSRHDIRNSLYVFGSNHYGQLGTGQSFELRTNSDDNTEPRQSAQKVQNMLKSLVPIKLILQENIVQIRTKLFTNLAVTEDNKLLTWGASPQAIRLHNQARKRLKASQRVEENLRNEQMVRADAELVAIDQNDNTKDVEEMINEEQKLDINIDVSVVVSDNEANENVVPTESINTSTENSENRLIIENLQDVVGNAKRDEAMSEMAAVEKQNNETTEKEITITITSPDNTETVDVEEVVDEKKKAPKRLPSEDEPQEHLFPNYVDTSEVIGDILEVATGLYHYALVDTNGNVYTWGKNLEKQLGKESSRIDVPHPALLDSIMNACHVDCGSDFTLVVTRDNVVKAFGNNSNGQCGREISPDKNGLAGKLVRLRLSKRLVRIPDGSQCIEMPVDIPLPRPKIRLDTDPVRYLKSVPKFRPKYVIKSNLYEQLIEIAIKRDATIASNINELSLHEDVDVMRTSNNSSTLQDAQFSKTNCASNRSSSYEILGTHTQGSDSDSSDFIHYCLYLFHGLYDANRVVALTSHFTEFKTRIMMLNYNYREAFQLCIEAQTSAQSVLKVFEFFTKDANIVPMHREDLKILIYELFMCFINRQFNISIVEEFFLSDIEYYLFALAYVIYFNNNNTDVERQVLAKYANSLFSGSEESMRNNFDQSIVIFNAISTKFKVFVCQRLVDYDDNFS